ncbi:serine phosphatase RsbU (regulator of sigma subunit) [Streptomyces sp. 846.5]|nr:SpoIIE family protein phosphatase [Streptomyces sp. 846.5]TDT97314.1 serine phosphatase RsbU (regulator of sigma subunit) [Streptomyces sp. 846.5]
MTGAGVDYAAVFQALPGMVALLDPRLVFVDANEDFVRLSGRPRERLIGRFLFDVFPDNPENPGGGARNLEASLRRVLESGERDAMALQRYDVRSLERPGEWEERYWSPVNAPVLDAAGHVVLVVHRVEEVTELIRARDLPEDGRRQVLEAELYTRARELQELNERLRRVHARDREVALALQRAMLPHPRPLRRHRAAVRYRPATGALNVCGDWYDITDLDGGDRAGVSVGDVVGHGLEAACVMGQLRSALAAASRVADGPAQALDVLGRYAGFVDGAESTTAVTCFVDWDRHTITYSSAGHPPPAHLHADGTVTWLDQALDPPLDASPEPGPRPEAVTVFTEGEALVLFTDGLIERRHQDITTGLDRLAASLAAHAGTDPEALADAVLADLLPRGGITDDTALVVLQL